MLELTDYSSHFSLSQKSSKERQVVAIKVMVVPTVEIQVEHQLQFLIDLSRYEIVFCSNCCISLTYYSILIVTDSKLISLIIDRLVKNGQARPSVDLPLQGKNKTMINDQLALEKMKLHSTLGVNLHQIS